ncbi:MAG: leucine-rich repeat protein, partial [Clostridia bacterium]|nr:leucine-rich repeat protein [Clostridia bacterium]
MTKKRIVLTVLLTVVMLVGIMGFVSCKKLVKKKDETPEQNYGEAGVYYTEVNGEEYTFTLGGNAFTLNIGEVLGGTYSYDGSVMTITADGDAPAVTVDGDVLKVTYKGGVYRFVKKVNYAITYATDGGSNVPAATVLNGKTLSKPADSEKAGYKFIGWYEDADYTKPYGFNEPVTANKTLYARFTENTGAEEFTVKFVYNGVENGVKQTVNGVVYDLPVVAEDNFDGWYVSDFDNEGKLTYKYEGQTLTENTTLYGVVNGNVPHMSVSADGIKWNAAGVNTEYILALSGPEGETGNYRGGSLNYAYDFSNKPAGEYEITLTVNGQSSKAYYNNKALSKVSNFETQGNVLIYNGVANAEKYVISVNNGDVNFEVNNGKSLTYNFDNCEMTASGIKFTVKAEAEGYVSSVSETYVLNRTLDAATGLYVNASTDTLIWNAVNGAAEYAVEVNGVKENVGASTTYDLKNYAGTLDIKVYASTHGYNPSESAALTYVKSKIATPSGISVTGNVVTWNAVEGAVSYNVKLGNKEYGVNGTEYDISSAVAGLSGAKSYQLSVQAVSNEAGKTSFYSNVVELKAAGEKDEIVYSNGKVSWKYAVGANFYQVRVNSDVATVSDGNEYPVTLTRAGYNDVSVRHNYGDDEYSEWTTVKVYAYRITYDVMGGSALEDDFKAVGDYVTLPETTLEGYNFNKWYLTPGGAAVNGKVFNNGAYSYANDIVLYASYNPKSYEVTLDLNNGGHFAYELTEEDTQVSYMQGYVLPVPESDDDTKAFGGWYTEANGKGIKYTDGAGNSLYGWRNLEGRTLVAYWVNMFTYKKINNNTAYSVKGVAAGLENATKLRILPVHDGLPVTTVEAAAFNNAGKLVTVEIPDTVINIESSAFTGCNKLYNIELYDAKAAFPDDEIVKDLEKGKYKSIDGVLFFENEFNGYELKQFPAARRGEYRIPEGTETLPTKVFYGANLDIVYIPGTVKNIDTRAFYYSTVRKVIFENSDKELVIMSEAFGSCNSLESITLPSRLKSVEGSVFGNSKNLTEIRMAEDGEYYSVKDGLLCNADGTEIVYAPEGFVGENGVYTVAAGVSKIGDSAFKNCKNITKLVVPGYVEYIGKNAFNGASNLSEIEFMFAENKASLTIDENAFYGCSKISEIVLPDNLVKLGTGAFQVQSSYSRIINHVNVLSGENVEFASGAFNTNANIETLYIGKDFGVVDVAEVFGYNVKEIVLDADNGNYTTMDDVLFDTQKTRIVYYPAGKTGNYIIPDTVEKIGGRVFYGKTNLTKVTINKGITEIGDYAFASCTKLAELVFEGGRAADAYLTIGKNAFYNTAIAEVVLPETVTEIGDEAFSSSALRTVSIPSTVTKMGAYDIDGNLTSMKVFDGCKRLYLITVSDDNENFATDASGALYVKNEGVKTELIMAPVAVAENVQLETEVDVPATVTKVWSRAFYNNTKITKVTFHTESNITLGSEIFSGATGLEEVILSNGFSSIGNGMFLGCSSIKSITIPATVTSIGAGAFFNCVSLENVIFAERTGSNTLTIEDGSQSNTLTGGSGDYGAFGNCVKLKNIVLPEGTKKIGKYAFATGYKATEAYKKNPATTDLGLESITIPSTVETIGDHAFAGVNNSIGPNGELYLEVMVGDLINEITGVISGLKNVTFTPKANGTYSLTDLGTGTFSFSNIGAVNIPSSVKEIKSDVFKGCINLETLTFAANSELETIGTNAFTGIAVTELTIPVSVASVGNQAFAYTRNLTEVEFELENGKSSLGKSTGSGGGGGGGFEPFLPSFAPGLIIDDPFFPGGGGSSTVAIKKW